MDFIKIEGRSIPVKKYGTLVIGSGCAGFNAADTLFDMGEKDIALVTEGINMGTSRNTGSDKQTYYKMSVETGEDDSSGNMARSLFSGQSVNGDTALCEAANSLRSFMKLVNLGVPFPTNKYGEFVGYRTDHDNGKRATSAGPLTSKFMTEALEKQVKMKGIEIIDNTVVVELIVKDKKLVGAIAIDKKTLFEENCGFVIYLTDNIIMATGGPAGIYKNSVYPCSQSGMSSLAIDAGAECANFQEWQYGIASVDFRWNLSGTYQQVIPKYISIDEDGVEREFLLDYFKDVADTGNYVFMKGYQWPFDSSKLSGSSVIDMIVYHEEIELGRKVYMDFRSEPTVLKDGFDLLSEEAYSYLKNSDALIDLPIKRLEKMNKPAIDLYMSHDIDLYNEPLRITVAAQHNNGGVAVDSDWETDIQGLYVAGEAAGTFGVYRPGGSALNSTQAGSLRAAESISIKKRKADAITDTDLMAECSTIENMLKVVTKAADSKAVNKKIAEIADFFAEKMSAAGAHLRDSVLLNSLKAELSEQIKALDFDGELSPADLPAWFKLKDRLTTQVAVIDSILYAGENIGSRGGSVFFSVKPQLESAEDIQKIPVKYDAAGDAKILCYQKDKGCYFKDVRPIPETDNWFENVWNEYKKIRSC